jgi:hypothetical protein
MQHPLTLAATDQRRQEPEATEANVVTEPRALYLLTAAEGGRRVIGVLGLAPNWRPLGFRALTLVVLALGWRGVRASRGGGPWSLGVRTCGAPSVRGNGQVSNHRRAHWARLSHTPC